MISPLSQAKYQVRFDWGVAGAREVGSDVDVIVWVDVLHAASASPLSPLLSPSPLVQGMPNTTVVAGSFANADAIAQWLLVRQQAKGDRFTIAVIAAGEFRADGSARFAVEDLLAAGAVIDALSSLGIDNCSPEAAATSAAFSVLRKATTHLVGSSGTGQEFTQDGRRAEVLAAAKLNSVADVHVLREFSPAR